MIADLKKEEIKQYINILCDFEKGRYNEDTEEFILPLKEIHKEVFRGMMKKYHQTN